MANIKSGTKFNDLIYGTDGEDRLYGLGGNDTIFGGSGNDILYGGRDADYLQGNAGRDVLYGEHGNDTLLGGMDNDTLYGGAGNNYLTGNFGDDVFEVRAKDKGVDIIMDFESGRDKIDLVNTDYSKLNIAYHTTNPFSWIPFSGGVTEISINASKGIIVLGQQIAASDFI
jgi:Ca2+-binding RTX toxin-like protein